MANCNICEASPCLPLCLAPELQVILDCMTGADGGVSYANLRAFLGLCAKQGNDVPFMRNTADLILKVNKLRA